MAVLVFFFGLIIGSFLNALIYRLASHESIFEQSSKCPKCGHKLSWLDLIPVGSFFILGRRCRYCRKPISWQYPLVEIATAVAFTLAYSVQRLAFSDATLFYTLHAAHYTLVFQLIFTCFLIIIFVYDLKHYLILDKVVFPAAGLAFAYQIVNQRAIDALIGAAILAGFFVILFFISRGRWIGAGDVKLGLFLGFLVPFPETIALFFLAYLLGATVSVWLLLAARKKFTDRLPFGTFLTAAAFIAMLWGERLITWYFHLIGIY